MTTTSEQGGIDVFDCRETVRRLWDYLDHELSPGEVRAVEAHLADCDRCPKHFTFEREFLAAVRMARAERGANAELRGRVRELLGMSGDGTSSGESE